MKNLFLVVLAAALLVAAGCSSTRSGQVETERGSISGTASTRDAVTASDKSGSYAYSNTWTDENGVMRECTFNAASLREFQKISGSLDDQCRAQFSAQGVTGAEPVEAANNLVGTVLQAVVPAYQSYQSERTNRAVLGGSGASSDEELAGIVAEAREVAAQAQAQGASAADIRAIVSELVRNRLEGITTPPSLPTQPQGEAGGE